MTKQTPQRPLHTEGNIADYFAIEAKVYSTLFSSGYKAIDRSRGGSAVLWMFNHPLQRNGAGVNAFLDRMTKIDQIDPAVSNLSAFGVDAEGIAFSVFPSLDGVSIHKGNLNRNEAERRFMSALKLAQRIHGTGIHKSNLFIGDLAADSFFALRSGEIALNALMGVNNENLDRALGSLSAEQCAFLAPELLSGDGSFNQLTDCYALGVLAYKLLTGELPFASDPSNLDLRREVPLLDQAMGNPPLWGVALIQSALAFDAADRATDADQLWKIVTDQIAQSNERTPVNRSPVGQQVQARAKNSLMTGPTVGANSTRINKDDLPDPLAKKGALTLGNQSAARLFVLGALFLVATFYLLFSDSWMPGGGKSSPSGGTDLAGHRLGAGNEVIRDAISGIGDDRSLAERALQLEKMANSDDPLAHDVLVKTARDANSERFRQMAEQAIIDRARRLGLLRSAEQVRQWLRTIKSGALPPNYEAVLQSLDTTLPMEARTSALRQAYPANPGLAMRVAAALALDSGKLEEYQPVLSQLVGDATKDETASKRSTLALILLTPELVLVFGDDAIQRREQIPDQDVVELLNVLAQRSDINLRAVASLAMERGLLSPLRASFLKLVRDRDDLDGGLTNALVRAASGALRVEDIAQFGRWYDTESEKVLLAVCADTKDPTTLAEAFDTLAGKSLVIEPSASLVNWVRANSWEKRSDFARPIGVVGSLALVDEAQIEETFKSLNKIASSRKVIDILAQSNDPRVVSATIRHFSGRLGLSGLLSLLSNPDKEIRIMAVRALKGYNDVAALRLIIQQYEQEKDPDVKRTYAETFWVIQQREEPKE